jgi:hypothetical protein
MAGGQKGLSFVGEPMMFAVVATVIICVLLGIVGCDDIVGEEGDSPMDAYHQACEQEYADANDGNAETEVETAILEQPDCMAYVAAMKTERQQAYQEQVEEAQP